MFIMLLMVSLLNLRLIHFLFINIINVTVLCQPLHLQIHPIILLLLVLVITTLHPHILIVTGFLHSLILAHTTYLLVAPLLTLVHCPLLVHAINLLWLPHVK